jgi:hypothetical protein
VPFEASLSIRFAAPQHDEYGLGANPCQEKMVHCTKDTAPLAIFFFHSRALA